MAAARIHEDDAGTMLLYLTLLFPLVLLGLMLLMERVERPLRTASVGDDLAAFLDTARPEEVEMFVREGFAPALDRYWRRRRVTRILAGRTLPGTPRRG